jgi:hypothetical protein
MAEFFHQPDTENILVTRMVKDVQAHQAGEQMAILHDAH